ncbi:hypothetical protein PanWU01x14_234510 [Parasponia andersonii]|uniref:Uncharacterized protein n=1 Tax=Parasponia andersonii TaxID=3476 RepID=A0A2P5BIZ2_PARAD|nr:hypothetical protein PanWU01x14_234510 [Parasponia andersonii]
MYTQTEATEDDEKLTGPEESREIQGCCASLYLALIGSGGVCLCVCEGGSKVTKSPTETRKEEESSLGILGFAIFILHQNHCIASFQFYPC